MVSTIYNIMLICGSVIYAFFQILNRYIELFHKQVEVGVHKNTAAMNTCGCSCYSRNATAGTCSELDNKRVRLLQTILPYGLDTYAVLNRPTFIKVKHGCIMFIDIVSYCNVVSENTDVIVFLILKKIYDMIDSVIVKYKHIQKVETIGDAYMVVGNMDTPTEYQPETYLEMVLFANELLTKIAHIGIPDRTIRLRIGIHAGSFVISFYGKIRPRLCVIGKHVNIAARIQSTAAPNTIHISKEMYGHILAYTNSSPPNSHTPEFSYCLNRDVELKHIGKVDTYTIRLSA